MISSFKIILFDLVNVQFNGTAKQSKGSIIFRAHGHLNKRVFSAIGHRVFADGNTSRRCGIGVMANNLLQTSLHHESRILRHHHDDFSNCMSIVFQPVKCNQVWVTPTSCNACLWWWQAFIFGTSASFDFKHEIRGSARRRSPLRWCETVWAAVSRESNTTVIVVAVGPLVATLSSIVVSRIQLKVDVQFVVRFLHPVVQEQVQEVLGVRTCKCRLIWNWSNSSVVDLAMGRIGALWTQTANDSVCRLHLCTEFVIVQTLVWDTGTLSSHSSPSFRICQGCQFRFWRDDSFNSKRE
mmetsp:Transcript_6220/g.14659  ORF Transcript_6220/g.14659 Transcript_6220/m.14659 type:complete len:296 (+) Transcript_6220:1009-1896(+)